MPSYTKQRSNWQDFPTTSTPILSSNLNAWEQAIYDVKHRIIDVKEDYGTTGTAIANALTDAGTQGGGIVELDEGVSWTWASTLQLPVLSGAGAVWLRGRGARTTTCSYTGSGKAIQIGDGGANAASWQKVSDLKLTGGVSDSGAIGIKGTNFCMVENCDLIAGTGGTKILIYFDPASGSVANYFNIIRNNRIRGVTSASDVGLKLYSTDATGANSNYVEHNHFAIFNQSVLIDGGDSNRIFQNEFNGTTTTGVRLQSTNTVGNEIMSNKFDGPTTAVDIAVNVAETIVGMNQGAGAITNAGSRSKFFMNASTLGSVTDTGTNTVNFSDQDGLTMAQDTLLTVGGQIQLPGRQVADPSTANSFIAATASSGAAYPYQEVGNLVVSSRQSGAARDVLFYTGNPATEKLRIGRAGVHTLTGQLATTDGVQTKYLSGAGKTTVVDADFTTTPPNGTLAVHFDSTATRTYLSVRSNGTWHVMAGPIV